MIDSVTKTVPVAGAAGSAIGGPVEIDLPELVEILKVGLTYTTQPATVDVVIVDENGTGVLTVPNANTNGSFYPRRTAVKADGTASTLAEVPSISSKLSASVAQGNAGSVAIEVTYRRDN